MSDDLNQGKYLYYGAIALALIIFVIMLIIYFTVLPDSVTGWGLFGIIFGTGIVVLGLGVWGGFGLWDIELKKKYRNQETEQLNAYKFQQHVQPNTQVM